MVVFCFCFIHLCFQYSSLWYSLGLKLSSTGCIHGNLLVPFGESCVCLYVVNLTSCLLWGLYLSNFSTVWVWKVFLFVWLGTSSCIWYHIKPVLEREKNLPTDIALWRLGSCQYFFKNLWQCGNAKLVFWDHNTDETCLSHSSQLVSLAGGGGGGGNLSVVSRYKFGKQNICEKCTSVVTMKLSLCSCR